MLKNSCVTKGADTSVVVLILLMNQLEKYFIDCQVLSQCSSRRMQILFPYSESFVNEN